MQSKDEARAVSFPAQNVAERPLHEQGFLLGVGELQEHYDIAGETLRWAIEYAAEDAIGNIGHPSGRGFALAYKGSITIQRVVLSEELVQACAKKPVETFLEARNLCLIARDCARQAEISSSARSTGKRSRELAAAALWRAVDARGILEILLCGVRIGDGGACVVARGEDGVELLRVPTGNGEPDVWRDGEGRAHWSDGSRVTEDECARLEDSEVLLDVVRRHKLTVLGFVDEEAAAAGKETEVRP